MKTIGFLFLSVQILPFCLFIIRAEHNPGVKLHNSTTAIVSSDNESKKVAVDTGKSFVTLNGVVYPFDSPPYSGGTLQDEHKFERTMVGDKPVYKDVKTGKRRLHFIFNDRKNGHTLTTTIYFDGKTGESSTLRNVS